MYVHKAKEKISLPSLGICCGGNTLSSLQLPWTSWGDGVFVFYCCETNYHKLSSLKQYSFISSQFCRSKILYSMGSLLRVSPGWNEGLAELSSHMEASKRHCFPANSCWQNSSPCSYETGIPASLLAVTQRLLSAPGEYSHSLPCGLLHCQGSNGASNPSHTLRVWLPLLWSAEEDSGD